MKSAEKEKTISAEKRGKEKTAEKGLPPPPPNINPELYCRSGFLTVFSLHLIEI